MFPFERLRHILGDSYNKPGKNNKWDAKDDPKDLYNKKEAAPLEKIDE